MDFFSEDYLMHYGIKGMKWKKKKAPDGAYTDTDTIDESASETAKRMALEKRYSENRHNLKTRDDLERVARVRRIAQKNRRIQKARKEAYLEGKTKEVNYRRLRAKFDQSRQKSYDAEKGRASQYAKKSSGFYRTQEWKDRPYSAVNTGDDRDYVHARMFKKRGR